MVDGWGFDGNGKCSYSPTLPSGRRARPAGPVGPGTQFLAVFDGHGGNAVSEWLQKELQPEFGLSRSLRIDRAYLSVFVSLDVFMGKVRTDHLIIPPSGCIFFPPLPRISIVSNPILSPQNSWDSSTCPHIWITPVNAFPPSDVFPPQCGDLLTAFTKRNVIESIE